MIGLSRPGRSLVHRAPAGLKLLLLAAGVLPALLATTRRRSLPTDDD